jgi:ADP-heptose:LPS heptosyltransferase
MKTELNPQTTAPPAEKPNLLVFEMRMVGDAIMSFPFIRAAQEKYTVHVCCQPSVSEVFRLLLPEEQVVPWRPFWVPEVAQYSATKSKNAETKSAFQRLRRVKAQIVLGVWADARDHVLMALTGAKTRIGFPMDKNNFYGSALSWRKRQIRIGKCITFLGRLCLGGELLTHKVQRRDYDQHHVEDWRQLAEQLGLKWSTDFPWFKVLDSLLPPEVSAWLSAARPRRQPIWLAHPGARRPSHRWPIEKFRTLIEQTFIARGIPVMIIDPLEYPLPRQWAPETLIYRPRGLMEFFSVLSAIDCVVCNDTGVSHAAAALGKRVVCIFGPTPPQCFAPCNNLDLVVQSHACPHSPCYDRCIMPSYVCLETITVEMVKQQIGKLIAPGI